jgi:hypothetical protein
MTSGTGEHVAKRYVSGVLRWDEERKRRGQGEFPPTVGKARNLNNLDRCFVSLLSPCLVSRLATPYILESRKKIHRA